MSKLSSLEVGDYIEGHEYYGSNVRKIKGWVEEIKGKFGSLAVTIKCDDGYKGRRKNQVYEHLGDIEIISKK